MHAMADEKSFEISDAIPVDLYLRVTAPSTHNVDPVKQICGDQWGDRLSHFLLAVDACAD